MALGQLIVRIGADFTDLNKATDKVDRDIQRLGRKLTSIGTELSMKVTAPIVAMGAAVLKAGIDFESSFAGIRKTMDLTEAEFSRLAQANRDLAREIPVAVEEINRIGELAGQLGIEGVDNVLKFERTIAQLAVTTDLTADDAALSFAQIANVMRIPQQDIDRLGATVVGLGNNFATVESKIVAFTQRIAGAGQLSGVAAGELVGIATAFSSIGVESEAGGTAVQKVLLGMVAAVAEGGAELNTFARTAGMSSAEFQRAFRDDAAGAFVSFVEGLGTQGDSAIGTLDALGLGNERVRAAFLSAAGAGDLLRTAVAQGSEEWAANTDLVAEAEKRFATAESQLRIFWNKLKDVGITLGEALIPALLSTIETLDPLIAFVASLATGFANLPAPIVGVVTGLVGLTAALGPVLVLVGQFLKVWPLLKVAFLAATGPAGWIGLVIAAVVLLTAAWAKWGDDIMPVVEATVAVIMDRLRDLVDYFQPVLDAIRTFVTAGVRAFRWFADNAIKPVVEFVLSAGDWLVDKLGEVIGGVSETLVFMVDFFNQSAGDAVRAIQTMVGDIRFEMARNRSQMLREASLAADGVVVEFEDMAVVVPTVVTEMATGVGEAFARMNEDILADIGEVVREVPAGFRTMDGELRTIVPAMVSEVTTESERMRDGLGEIFDQIRSQLPPKIQGTVTDIEQKWNLLRTIMETPLLGEDGALAKILDAVARWAPEVVGWIEQIIGAAGRLKDSLASVSGPGLSGGGGGQFGGGGGGFPSGGGGGGFPSGGGGGGFPGGFNVENNYNIDFGRNGQGFQALAQTFQTNIAWLGQGLLAPRWDALLALWERDHHWWSQAATETLNVRDHLAAIRAEILKMTGGFGLIENYLGTIAFEFAPIVEAVRALEASTVTGFDKVVAAVQGIEFPASPSIQPQVSGFTPAFAAAAPAGGAGFVVNQVFNFPAGVAATRQQIQASAAAGVDQALGQRAQRSLRLGGDMGVAR